MNMCICIDIYVVFNVGVDRVVRHGEAGRQASAPDIGQGGNHSEANERGHHAQVTLMAASIYFRIIMLHSMLHSRA